MFSMKYTSPKLTPKKGRESVVLRLHPPPPPSSPSPSSLPFASLDRAEDVDNTTRLAVVHYLDDGNSTITTTTLACDRPNITTSSSSCRDAGETMNEDQAPQSEAVESYNRMDHHGVESSSVEDTTAFSATTTTTTTQAGQIPINSTSMSLVDSITPTSNNHPDENDDSGEKDGCQDRDLHDYGRRSADDSNDFTSKDAVDYFDSKEYSEDRLRSAHNNYSSSTHHHQHLSDIPKSSSSYFGYQRSISSSMEPMMLHASPADESASPAAELSSRMTTSRELAEQHDDAQLLFALPCQQEEDDVAHDDPISPMVYDLSARPIIASATMTPGRDPIIISMGSPRSETTESDTIGGDAYFDEPFFHPNGNYRIKPRCSDGGIEEDAMLPPRVNRTTTNDYAAGHDIIRMPFLPGCFPQESSSPSAPARRMPLEPYPIPQQPRPPFSHTHSLLDDCSDDEDDAASSFFMMADSPTRRGSNARRTNYDYYYSCFPPSTAAMRGDDGVIERGSQPTSTSSSHPSTATGIISNASLKASNNIQRALLQTRHRRWDCQSALAGPHAQSKEILDLSHRCYYYGAAGYPRRRPLPDDHPSDDGTNHSCARLSVSADAVRAAALASGLWRTVRCVRLPRGVLPFWSQKRHETTEEDDIWALLRMLNSTFPILVQIDFGGEIECVVGDAGRRNEIVTRIVECLPRIAAIDGFVVEQFVLGKECRRSDEKSSSKSEEGTESEPGDANHVENGRSEASDAIFNAARSCGECEPVPMCGFSDLVDGEALNGILDADLTDKDSYNTRSGMTNRSESLSVCEAEKRVDSMKISSSRAQEDGTLEHLQYPTHDELQSEQRMIRESASVEFSDDEVSRVQPKMSSSSSTLSSSLSWGSNGSGGSRPPPCPNSASTHRLHPRLPTMPKGSSSIRKAGNRLKRRVLGLIPTVSIMDEDEEEDDENSEESDNSMDADRHADIL